jgi:hypothetical protein
MNSRTDWGHRLRLRTKNSRLRKDIGDSPLASRRLHSVLGGLAVALGVFAGSALLPKEAVAAAALTPMAGNFTPGNIGIIDGPLRPPTTGQFGLPDDTGIGDGPVPGRLPPPGPTYNKSDEGTETAKGGGEDSGKGTGSKGTEDNGGKETGQNTEPEPQQEPENQNDDPDDGKWKKFKDWLRKKLAGAMVWESLLRGDFKGAQKWREIQSPEEKAVQEIINQTPQPSPIGGDGNPPKGNDPEDPNFWDRALGNAGYWDVSKFSSDKGDGVDSDLVRRAGALGPALVPTPWLDKSSSIGSWAWHGPTPHWTNNNGGCFGFSPDECQNGNLLGAAPAPRAKANKVAPVKSENTFGAAKVGVGSAKGTRTNAANSAAKVVSSASNRASSASSNAASRAASSAAHRASSAASSAASKAASSAAQRASSTAASAASRAAAAASRIPGR